MRWSLLCLFIGLIGIFAQAQQAFPLSTELFAPNITIKSVVVTTSEYIVSKTPTPEPTLQPDCGYVPYHRFSTAGDWFFDLAQQTDEGIELTLCNEKTQEIRVLAISEVIEGVVKSPSGNLVILITRIGFYRYDIAKDDLFYLGDRSVSLYTQRNVSWYSENYIVIRQFEGRDTSAYIDVSMADIKSATPLRFIGSILKNAPVPFYAHYGNPSYIEWIDYKDDGCVLKRLYEFSGQYEVYDLTSICVVGTALTTDLQGDYLFAPIRYKDYDSKGNSIIATQRDLIRHNLTTGESNLLYSGEVEQVTDIDPEGRFASLVLDDSRCFDLVPADLYYNDVCEQGKQPNSFVITLMNLLDGKSVWQYPVPSLRGNFEYRVFNRESGEVFNKFSAWGDYNSWVGGNLFSSAVSGTFFFLTARLYPISFPSLEDANLVGYNDKLILIDAQQEITETQLPGQLLLAGQNNAYLLLADYSEDDPDTNDNEVELKIYEPRKDQGTLLMNAVISSDQIWWTSDEQSLLVTLSRGSTSDEMTVQLYNQDQKTTQTYVLAIPD